MFLPTIRFEIDTFRGRCFDRRFSVQRRMASVPVHGELMKSRGDRRLVKAATVFPPPVRHKTYRLFPLVATGFWQPSLQSGMRAIAVKIISEREKLHLQVYRRPE